MQPLAREASAWHTAQFVSDDGVVLTADVGGDCSRPTVVLMHGGGQTRHSWAGTMQALVDSGYHVINYDARGHGDSGWSADGVYTFAQRAADLRAILDSVQGKFALIGASMGGITALEAIGNGLTPAAAVLVDIVLRPEARGVERVRAFMASNPDGFASLEEAVQAVAAYNPRRNNPGDPRKLMRNLRQGEDGRLRWHWDPRMVPENVTRDLEIMAEIVERLERAPEVPVLLVRGRHSDVLSDASVADFRRYLPSAEIFNVPGAGHMVAGDSNDVFTAGAVEFLGRFLPASSSEPSAQHAHTADSCLSSQLSTPRAKDSRTPAAVSGGFEHDSNNHS